MLVYSSHLPVRFVMIFCYLKKKFISCLTGLGFVSPYNGCKLCPPPPYGIEINTVPNYIYLFFFFFFFFFFL